MLVTTGISNEKTKCINHIWNIMLKRPNIFRKELASLCRKSRKRAGVQNNTF